MASKKTSHSRLRFSWRTFIFGIVLLLLMFVLYERFIHGFEEMDLFAYDLRINTLAARPSSGVVAIAAIDDKSIAQLGQWPWPRNVIAQLVDALKFYQVKVAGFDVMFSETDENDITLANLRKRLSTTKLSQKEIDDIVSASNDATLAASMKAQGSTVLGYAFESIDADPAKLKPAGAGYLSKIIPPGPLTYGIVRRRAGQTHNLVSANGYLPPIPVLSDAMRTMGNVDVDHDADGEIRRELTVIHFDNKYCAPFFMAVADVYAGGSPLALGLGPDGVTGVTLAGVKIPVDDAGRMLVNFRRGKDPFAHYSISDIIHHKVPAEALKDKIVLVGMTAQGLGDRTSTPIFGDMPRVEIHAHAIDNIIQGDFIRQSFESEQIAFIAALVLGVAMSLGVAWLSALSSAALGLALAVGYYVYAQQRLMSDGLVVDVVFPLMTALLVYMFLAGYRYITEGREKRQLRIAFEHYLNPDVITSVLDSPEGLKLGGELRHLAIMFADIVSFTSRAERTAPTDLVALLNTYMTSMIDVIFKTGGVVDKLMGDGIMAFWGAPNDLENPSRSAIDCAIKMLANLRTLQTEDPRFADLDIGIGIATGDVVVGNIGGENRFDYSVIGDTVNFASRLEGLTRHFKVHLLVSLQTWTEAGAGYIGRELGLVKVKGKEILVPIVEVAGMENDSVDPTFYRHFGDALTMIRAGNAFSARQQLERLSGENPGDAPVRIYLDKLDADPDHPPSEMVFEFERK